MRLLAVIVGSFAAPAFAQAIDFASIDVNQSGTTSLAELQAVSLDVTDETFSTTDID